MSENGHITIFANANTLKPVMVLKKNYQINFRPHNSINSVFGFSNKIDKSKYQEFENAVNIRSLNSVLVNIDTISGSYVNGSTQPTIYSFFTNVSTGYKIIETPVNLVHLPITSDAITSITVWLTDQNRNNLTCEEKICQCDFI